MEQLHQEMDFRSRAPSEIFSGKSIERQRGQADARRCLHHQADSFHALAMPGNAWQMAAFGPAAIAVHDDGDMFGKLAGIKLAEKLSFLAVQPCGNCSQYCLSVR